MSQWLKEGQCGWDLVGENESIVEKGLEKQEVGQSRWDIVNHGKESVFNSVNRKPLENYVQENDSKFTLKEKKMNSLVARCRSDLGGGLRMWKQERPGKEGGSSRVVGDLDSFCEENWREWS